METAEWVSERLRLDTELHIAHNSDTGASGWLTIEDTDTTVGSQRPHIAFQGNGTEIGRIRVLDTTGMQFATGSSATIAMTIDQSQNVGIGTTGIDSILHIKDTGKLATLTIESDANMAGSISFISPTSTDGGISMDSDGDFRIGNSANTGFLLTGDTAPLLALGVNNFTPTQQLHLNDNIRVEGAYYDSTNSAGSNGQVLSSTNSGTTTAWVTPSSGGGIGGSTTATEIAFGSATASEIDSESRI